MHKVGILTVAIVILTMFTLGCDPDVTTTYEVQNKTDSSYTLVYATYSEPDSTILLRPQSSRILLWQSMWATDVFDARDSIANIIRFLELYNSDSILVYEQNPTLPEAWDFESNQKSMFLMNMGGTATHRFVITEDIL